METQKLGRTTKMLIEAIQFAADNPGSAVLVCMQDDQGLQSIRVMCQQLAEVMGFKISEFDTWFFRINDSSIHFRAEARSKQHAIKLIDGRKAVKLLFDHRTSGELQES